MVRKSKGPNTTVENTTTKKYLVNLGTTTAKNSMLAAGLRRLTPGARAEVKRTAPPSQPMADIMWKKAITVTRASDTVK